MAFTQQDLDAINKAIARGERVIQYADRRVEYRNISELIAARNLAISDLSVQAGHAKTRQHRMFHAGKGI
ncbi:MAG: hypothetical protein NT086_11105 [Proteobacteria bacterium]|nr:hypothetical protein [Pseudomonadota bacterium]